MAEILTGIITELAAEAIIRSAGPLTRMLRISKPTNPPAWLTKSLSPSVAGNVLSMLAELKSRNIPEDVILKTADSLRSTEAQQLQRMLVVNAITSRSGSQGNTKEQVEALLIYVGGCRRDDAQIVAPLLAQIMTGAALRSLDSFQTAANKHYGVIRSLALQEETAGYVEQLFSKSGYIARPTTNELAAFDRFAASYAEEMFARTAWLTPQHFDVQTRVRLEELYVPPRFEARGREVERLMPMADTTNIYASEINFPLGHAMRRMYRAVVLGAPGAGKTTLTQKIIHDLCADSSTVHTCIPFLVTLRKYDERRRDNPLSIPQHIASSISTELHITVPEGSIEYFFHSGRAVVILDGLDELLQPSRRRDLTEIVHSFSRRYPKISIIVTSRVVGYDEASLDSKIFAHMHLADFNDNEVGQYAFNWFRLTPTLDPDEKSAVAQDFLHESRSVADLRTNPLLLSLMCNIYRGKGYIPQNRSDLYERCATMLFEEWDQSRGIDSGGPLRGDAKYALQDIAHWALTHRELNVGIPEPALKRRLVKFLKIIRYGSTSLAEEAASDLLKMWRGRAWILTDLGSDTLHRMYQFSHRTFLEYFAAAYIARKSKTARRLWRDLRDSAISGEWDVIAEIAIQIYNAGHAGATNEIYGFIISGMDDVSNISELTADVLEQLRFSCQHLEALAPGPRVLRDLTVIAVKFILWTLPCIRSQPDWRTYHSKSDLMIPEAVRLVASASTAGPQYDEEDYEYEDEEVGREFRTLEETVRLLNTPLAVIFDSSSVILTLASTAFDDYCRELVSSADRAAASIALLMLMSKLQFIESSQFSVLDGKTSMSAQALPSALKADSLAVVEALPDGTIEDLGRENFWVPLIATRYGHRGLPWLLDYSGVGAFFNADSPFDVIISLARPCLAEESILRYLSGHATSDDREALGKIGRLARSAYTEPNNVPLIERAWLMRSDIETHIVRRYFLNTSKLGPEDGYYDRYWQREDLGYEEKSCAEEDLDVILGCAFVLCVFSECENWEMEDLSADRLASLALGSVDGLEAVYLMRYGGETLSAEHFHARTGLAMSDIKILLRWASNSVDFVYGRSSE